MSAAPAKAQRRHPAAPPQATSARPSVPPANAQANAPPQVSPSPRPPRVLPIRWVGALGAMLLTTLVGVSVVTVAERNTRNTLTEELVRRLCIQVSHLALVSSSAMLNPYPELTLHPMLRVTRERQPELALAVVTDRAGIIQGDADARSLGQPFVAPGGLAARPGDAFAPGVALSENAAMLLAATPVLHPNGARLGMAYMALDRRYVEKSVREARGPLLLVLVVLLACGVLGSFLLLSRLLRPIETLSVGLKRIGRGDLDTPVLINPRTELGQLALTVNRMAGDLKIAQREALETERLAHEMQLAQRIQRSLLPSESLIEGPFVMTGSQRPAAEVGGDFYETFKLPDGRIGFVVADVSGKGLGGCMLASMLAATLGALRESCRGPAELLGSVDRRMSRMLERGAFVTVFIGFLDPRTGTLVYASAGHHPALLLRADGRIEWLKARGRPIGTRVRSGAEGTFEEQLASVEPGDLVLQTTDGIHEAEGPDGSAFGIERMAEEARRAAPRGARAVLEAMSAAIERWRGDAAPYDDETLLVLSRERVSASAEPFDAPAERVAEARARGVALRIPATLDALVRLDDWVEKVPELAALPWPERDHVRLILHELCANIVEHGYHGAADRRIELWWVPADPAAADAGPGHFVIVDQGEPFSADNCKTTDWSDPGVRRRGRGMGLDLVRRASRRLVIHPGTAVGNVTLVAPGTPGEAGPERKGNG